LFEFILRAPEKRIFVLLDEVQYLNDPSNFLKLLYDKYSPQLKVIAAGSSASSILTGNSKIHWQGENVFLSFLHWILMNTLNSGLPY